MGDHAQLGKSFLLEAKNDGIVVIMRQRNNARMSMALISIVVSVKMRKPSGSHHRQGELFYKFYSLFLIFF